MPAPEIAAFGDGSHDIGETGLVVDGGGFGAFPGSLWIYENQNRTGAADELTVGNWNDIQLTGVEIPGSVNNAGGTRYLFLQREDLAWSQGFEFTLSSTAVVLTGTIASASVFDARADLNPGLSGPIDSASAMSGVLGMLADVVLSGSIVSEGDASARVGLTQGMNGPIGSESLLTANLTLLTDFLLSGTIRSESSIAGAARLASALRADASSQSELSAVLALGLTPGWLVADEIKVKAALEADSIKIVPRN